jgi:hypothetical protein
MRIFGLKTNEIIGSRRKLHNEVLHNLCFFPNFYNYNDRIKENEIDKDCITLGRHDE